MFCQVIDLRRIVAARERSLESLRSTLNTTRQFLEDRLSEAGDSLSAKDAEVVSTSMLTSLSLSHSSVRAIQHYIFAYEF